MNSPVKALFFRVNIVWLGLLFAAFLNGTLREVLLTRFFDHTNAQQLSVLTAVLGFTFISWSTWTYWRLTKIKEAIWVGAYWLLLTFVFETIVLNRLVGKMSWDAIRNTYDVSKGELWILVLIWLAVLPTLTLMCKRYCSKGSSMPGEARDSL